MNVTDQVNETQELAMDLARAFSVKWWGNNLLKVLQRVFVCLFIVGNEPVKKKN